MLTSFLRQAVDTIYPPRCLACPEPTAESGGLCPDCWQDVAFITGPRCPSCAAPVLEDGISCADCIRHPPAWDRGAAAVLYDGVGRRAVLSFKHGDRVDLAPPLARWIERAAAPLLARSDVIVPVPLHWRRLLRRGYNQAALLSRHLGRLSGIPAAPAALMRHQNTPPLKGLGREARHALLRDALRLHQPDAVTGRRVLLIDDVLTSGATLSAAAEVLRAGGAKSVDIAVIARVTRFDPSL